nr:PREDICTED: uncharacterized protein LOC102361024 isoform X2 [Latimeria chalumnae]|eukprot:XP_014348625.1 PREDICTED: uncharacterized protein LOC102361024 isoform X2 [Latimeria chalumnae]
MLININVGAKERRFHVVAATVCRETSILMDITVGGKDVELITPPPLPPALPPSSHPPVLPCYPPQHSNGISIPPPPPPPPLPLPPSGCLLSQLSTNRKSKLKNFNWDAIPKDRILGKKSLWNPEQFTDEDFQIDTCQMEKLFGQKDSGTSRRWHRERSWKSHLLGDPAQEKVFLLDSKRSMNIGIFLKQFKRSVDDIIEDIKRGVGGHYGSEKLTELVKLLPEADEVKHFQSFQDDHRKLGDSDLFILLLLEVPSYRLRLEALILKEEFQPRVFSLLASIRTLRNAAQELVSCSELHITLHLVLRAGNYLNAEAQKKNKNLLSFPDKLKSVGAAARLSEDLLLEDFHKLQRRVSTMKTSLREDPDVREQMETFLRGAESGLLELQQEVEAMQESIRSLLEFFCEDEETFKLEECCKVFKIFCEKILKAVQENTDREIQERKQLQREKEIAEKRCSVASCTSVESEIAQDELEIVLEKNLRNAFDKRSLRRQSHRSLGFSISKDHSKRLHCSSMLVPFQKDKEIAKLVELEDANHLHEVSEKVLVQQMEHPLSHNKNRVPEETPWRSNSITELKSKETEGWSSSQTPQPVPQCNMDYPKVGETVECRMLVKGLKSYKKVTSSSPCPKWSRENLGQKGGNMAGERAKHPKPKEPECEKVIGHSIGGSMEKRGNPVGAMSGAKKKESKGKKTKDGVKEKSKPSKEKKSLSILVTSQGHKGLKLENSSPQGLVSSRTPKPIFSRGGLQTSIYRKSGTNSPCDSKAPVGNPKETQEPLRVSKLHSTDDKSKIKNLRVVENSRSEKEKAFISVQTVAQSNPLSSSKRVLGRLNPAGTYQRDSSLVHLRSPQSATASKLRTVTPPTPKIVKHCDPGSPSQKSIKLGKPSKTGALPIWR